LREVRFLCRPDPAARQSAHPRRREEAVMAGHGKHLAICLVLAGIGGAAALAGLGALKLVAGAACMAMMGMMVWMMVRGMRS
jgi:hypothetical protein